ncbi:transposase [Aeromicrobium sp. Root472D3]|nr:transposase [Aeromicrobium sp. Root472D3]
MHSTPDDQPTAAPTDQPEGEVLGADAANTTEKDPNDWVTGDEPMTGAQRSYLDTLARDAGETLTADLTKAEASEHIDRLQEKTGRGTES